MVLEAGCGYGTKCVLFNKYYNASVVGVDIVLEPLKTLRDYLSNAPCSQVFVCNCDITNLPFRDGTFDVITSFGVIEHFRSGPEVLRALGEAQRVLRTGGSLILTIPSFAATFRNKLVIALSKGRFGMYHRPYTRRALVNMLSAVKGLKVIEIGFLPFGFRSLILSVVKTRSLEKAIYFLYHAVWHTLNLMLRLVGEDYQNQIYALVKVERCSTS